MKVVMRAVDKYDCSTASSILLRLTYSIDCHASTFKISLGG